MKTTLEIKDDLFREAKATAALRGETLKDLVSTALREHLGRQRRGDEPVRGWRAVFGKASREQVAEIDAVVASDLEQVDQEAASG